MRTILCLADAEKGHAFLRAVKERGFKVILLTREGLRHGDWPWQAIDQLHTVHDLNVPRHLMDFTLWLARREKIDVVVGLDEFDTTRAAAIREMLRVPGMSLTDSLRWRDKLAMREVAHAAGVAVPEFVPFQNEAQIVEFLGRTKGPWLVKPRMLAGSLNIRKYSTASEVRAAFERLGSEAVDYLLEVFIPGPLYHVDGIVDGGRVKFVQAHKYGRPLFEVAHGGGVFTSANVERGSATDTALKTAHDKVTAALGMQRGVTHAEFIEGADGKFYFVETAARVGGAHLSDLIEQTSGLNLWREWGILSALAPNEPYTLPATKLTHGGLALCLAKQKKPDYSTFPDPEIALRIEHEHHAGLVVRTTSAARAEEMIRGYVQRFTSEFLATLPVVEKGVGIEGPYIRQLFMN